MFWKDLLLDGVSFLVRFGRLHELAENKLVIVIEKYKMGRERRVVKVDEVALFGRRSWQGSVLSFKI